MLAKALVARKMNVPAETAWNAISKVGRLDVWFPTISTCRVEGDGIGANRYMTLDRGGEIVDRIVDIDPQRRRLVYDRTRSPFPVSSYRGTVEVFESYDSLAVVVWTVDFESAPESAASMKSTLEAGIGAGIEGMAADLSSS